MKTVDDILTDVLVAEGWPRLTDSASDKGGLTKGGITFASYNAWRRQQGKAAVMPTEFAATVTEDEARKFMLDQIAGPLLPVRDTDPHLFALVVDWAETSGPATPVRALQATLRGLGSGITVDGAYGSSTHAALAKADVAAVYSAVAKARVEFYVVLATERDPAVKAFRAGNTTTDLENVHGWVLRSLSFL